MKRSHTPNLRGDMQYVDTPRNANYVETHTYQQAAAELRKKFGVPDLSERYGTTAGATTH